MTDLRQPWRKPAFGHSYIKGDRFPMGNLNGHQITNSVLNDLDPLPDPVKCKVCGRPVFHGQMGMAHTQGTFEEVEVVVTGFIKHGTPAPPWTLDFHNCPGIRVVS